MADQIPLPRPPIPDEEVPSTWGGYKTPGECQNQSGKPAARQLEVDTDNTYLGSIAAPHDGRINAIQILSAVRHVEHLQLK